MLVPAALRTCDVRDLGAMRWGAAYALQAELVGQRQRGEIGDQLLLVEHPHVVTMGRNGQSAHLLASAEVLAATGIEYHETNRGGDVTYHGPGQLVGYPIVQLNEWKRDVHAYVRALEEVIIRVLADFGLAGERVAGATGVWTRGAKICAIGVHLSRWVSSHGFALNVTTDLQYFQYIVPCGLTKPVTSLRKLGVAVSMDEVKAAVRRRFAEVYEYQ
ncbi:MAG: lipoyl(octanoyl) transferase LipB [Acidobacteriota bacterium]|jgi:lipoyl(octanoyl) transferase|nr:lipoyl(octanoyl) transferase LipB [Bryobacteraceae bacterium CoA2 C42]MCA2962977.1 lipoyl(octanoyl) transferase LipB [Acidobacteriaceae bacterium]